MDIKKAKQKGFTNKGYMFDDIPVFVKFHDDDSFEVVGINLFWNLYLNLLTFIDLQLNFGKSFELLVSEELI